MPPKREIWNEDIRRDLGIAPIPQNPALEDLLVTVRANNNRPAFRSALEGIGRFLAYQIAEDLPDKPITAKTSLGEAQHFVLAEQPTLVTLMRAGLPLAYGVAQTFPYAEQGFIGTMRDEETHLPKTTYVALPDLRGKRVVVIDPMLATGGSMNDAIDIVRGRGAALIYVCCTIAAVEGINAVMKNDVLPAQMYVAALDSLLNVKKYIVAGCGDAGDGSFGIKID